MNKTYLLIIGVVSVVLLTVVSALFYVSRNNQASPTTSPSKELQNILPVTGYLEISQKPPPNTNAFDVVFRDTNGSVGILGFSLDIKVSPVDFNALGSTLTAGPTFKSDNFLFPLKKITPSKTEVLFSLAAIRSNPKANIVLKDGDVLASVTLKGAKKGTYQVTIDNTTSTVLNESNTSLTKPFEGNVTINI